MGKGAQGEVAGKSLRRTPSALAQTGSQEQLSGVNKRYSRGASNWESTSFTWDEIRSHHTEGDAWIVIKGLVYDVTDFAPMHPGGRAIYCLAGKDATETFTAFHENNTWKRLGDLRIGRVSEESQAEAPTSPFHSVLHLQGAEHHCHPLCRPGPACGVPQVHGSLVGCSTSRGPLLAAGGWLSHDFCHNQVFKYRPLNHALGLFTGNVLQGFSVAWWKGKHNSHHAVPNEIDGAMPVDPDIDTLPFIAWDENILKDASPSVRTLVRYQHQLFFPILFFARISWATQGVQTAIGLKDPTQRLLETSLIGLHYAWMMSVPLYAGLSIIQSVLFLVVAEMLSGFLLGFVFVQSHNAMEIYDGSKDFASAQLVSTRNIFGGVWNDWFSGGLNRQIEHHLFPTMPRHNLAKTADAVKDLCVKHGYVYEEVGWFEATQKVLACLQSIAAVA
ncbi:hypothetical protein CYMTET_48456 [Cymbomonas tetramitiformis]|uniref:Cytochrome b5 heme-binding domain-containing protein n=1 Tax=Cymbomonas tetramitiformis TaxID=36881 RepID=A0AAE0BS81_9CHLO|nr:hypothetical protein CYMTET_48456 [Cymbomonas tetramitiformis]